MYVDVDRGSKAGGREMWPPLQ